MPRPAGGEQIDWRYDSAGTPVNPGPNRISLWVESVKHSVKCETRGFHRRKRVSLEELSLLRGESRKSGRRAWLI